ncbi:MAG: SPOR domain-containing protein [Candidatus Omnitrophica bacterium]|nr:SPOR domain-containing protein [Candidatus Omnitrophota bacterium]
MKIKKIFLSLFFCFLILVKVSQAGSPEEFAKIKMAVLKQDFNLVQELSRQYLSNHPKDIQVFEVTYYLALSYIHLDQYNEALTMFKQLRKKKLDSNLRDKVYLGFFDALYLNEQYKAALKTMNKLRKINPDSEFLSLILLKSARVNLKLTNWNEAYMQLSKIVDDFPDSLEARFAQQLLEEKQYFAVQVGAFLDRKRAEKVMMELKAKDEYAYIVETVNQHNQKFYRVRVGQLAGLNDAKKLKRKLSKQGYPTTIYP